VLYDDRQERPVVLNLRMADLIGYPVRIVIGKKAISEGLVELKWRATGELIFKEKDKIL